MNRIIEEAIVPRLRYLSAVVMELLDCAPSNPRVMQCVGSVHGLCLVYSRMLLAPPLRVVAPDLTPGSAPGLESAVEHVTKFSLARIRPCGANSGCVEWLAFFRTVMTRMTLKRPDTA